MTKMKCQRLRQLITVRGMKINSSTRRDMILDLRNLSKMSDKIKILAARITPWQCLSRFPIERELAIIAPSTPSFSKLKSRVKLIRWFSWSMRKNLFQNSEMKANGLLLTRIETTGISRTCFRKRIILISWIIDLISVPARLLLLVHLEANSAPQISVSRSTRSWRSVILLANATSSLSTENSSLTTLSTRSERGRTSRITSTWILSPNLSLRCHHRSRKAPVASRRATMRSERRQRQRWTPSRSWVEIMFLLMKRQRISKNSSASFMCRKRKWTISSRQARFRDIWKIKWQITTRWCYSSGCVTAVSLSRIRSKNWKARKTN